MADVGGFCGAGECGGQPRRSARMFPLILLVLLSTYVSSKKFQSSRGLRCQQFHTKNVPAYLIGQLPRTTRSYFMRNG